MERIKYELVVDDITLMDLLVFEKAVGTKLFTALSPRIIRDEDTGQPIMVPDPENPGGRERPLKSINMSTEELLGAVLIAKRQQDRSVEGNFTKLADIGRLKMSEIQLEINWGDEESSEDSGNPTEPEAASTDGS